MIHVQHLSKHFGELKAVDGVSFDVQAGEIFAFLGPNGAGKTTTIQMLTTLLRPTGRQHRARRDGPGHAPERGRASGSASCSRTPASTAS